MKMVMMEVGTNMVMKTGDGDNDDDDDSHDSDDLCEVVEDVAQSALAFPDIPLLVGGLGSGVVDLLHLDLVLLRRRPRTVVRRLRRRGR